jgi:hypothetical protein
MAVGFPLKTTYANGDVYSASDVNDTNGTINLLTSTTLSNQAGKNAIINGGFDVWQRGTSIAATATNGVYTADRWLVNRNGAVTGATITRQTTSDTTNLPSIQYCARVSRDSGNTSTQIIRFGSPIETINSIPYAGKTVNISFYARKGANYSAASSALAFQIMSGTGTDQNNFTVSYTGETTVLSSSVTLTTTWQRFTASATVGATATELLARFEFTPVGTAGAADYYEITGVQLELGATATTFSRAGGTIQGELAACQRYYWQTGLRASRSFGVAQFVGAADGLAFVALPVTMRVNPSNSVSAATDFEVINAGGSSAIALTAISFGEQSVDGFTANLTTASGMTAGQASLWRSKSAGNATLKASAEL